MKPPEPAAQRADSEQIVAAILAAAIELGPDATLASVAERAGVGKASLHRYFPTVTAIFAEVSRTTYRTLLDQVREITHRPGLDLRQVVEEVCAVALRGPNVSLAYRRRMNLEIPLAWSKDAAEEIYAAVLAELAGWVERNVAEPPADLAQRIFVAFASVRGVVLVSLLFPDLAPPMDELAPHVVDLVVHSLCGGEPAPIERRRAGRGGPPPVTRRSGRPRR